MQNEESITVFSSRMKTLMKEHKQIKITEMKKKKKTHTHHGFLKLSSKIATGNAKTVV